MIHKRYYSFMLALTISANSFAMDKSEESNFQRKFLLLAGATIVTIVFLTKLKSWLKSYSSHRSTNHSTDVLIPQSNMRYDIINICNNEITINHNELSLDAIAKLPLIKTSGNLEIIDINESIECIQIPGCIAVIHIDKEKKPRIEKDEAFKDLSFIIANGILTVTTPNSEPRKFSYNNKSLCTIYAHLLANKLVAKQHADVTLRDQQLHTIQASNFSRVSGLIEPTASLLDLTCSDHASLHIIDNSNQPTREKTTLKTNNFSIIDLQGKRLGVLDATIQEHSKICTTGKVKNQTIIAHNFSTFDGTRLKAKGGDLNAQAKNYSKIYVAGQVSQQTIVASNFGIFDGSKMHADDANIDIKDHSEVNLGCITTKITGKPIDNFSILKYKGNPQILVTKKNFSKIIKE